MKKGRIIKNADHCTVFEGYYSVMFPLHSILNGTIPVAIKEWTVYPKDEYHFNREVRINMNVDHPNIIKTYGYYPNANTKRDHQDYGKGTVLHAAARSCSSRFEGGFSVSF